MMKWNSAKTYTEEDMMRMQQEAVERVRDFQERARSAASFYDVPPTAIAPVVDESAPPDPAPEPGPYVPAPEAFRPAPFFGGLDPSPSLEQPEVIEAQSRVVPEDRQPAPPAPAHPGDPIHGLLDRLGVDSETLLILGLIFLLYNEKADNILLLALAYLLL